MFHFATFLDKMTQNVRTENFLKVLLPLRNLDIVRVQFFCAYIAANSKLSDRLRRQDK